MNPYQILGITSEDSEEDIRRKYLVLVKRNHPDLYPDEEKENATKKMQIINQAYEEVQNRRRQQADADKQTNTTSDDFTAAAQAFWAAWAAWAKAYSEQEKCSTKTQRRETKNTNRYAYFKRSHEGAGSYKTVGSDTVWSRVIFDISKENIDNLIREMSTDVRSILIEKPNGFTGLFYKEIYNKLLYYAAAEYIDPFSSFKTKNGFNKIGDSKVDIEVVVRNSHIIDRLSIGDDVLLQFHHSFCLNPYSLQLYTEDGDYIGYDSSDTAVLLSLMYSTGKVSYEAKIKYLSYLLRGSKGRGKVTPPTIMISIQTIMAEEVQARYLPNNQEAIDNLLALYSDYSIFTNQFFMSNKMSVAEAVGFFDKFDVIASNKSEYELGYKVGFSILPNNPLSLTTADINGVSLTHPIYTSRFNDTNRDTFLKICSACMEYEAVSHLFSCGKRTLRVEDRDYQYIVTIRRGTGENRFAIGIYVYSKKDLISLMKQ